MAQSLESNVCPGLFYTTPASDGRLVRIRVTGGILNSNQAETLATFAQVFGDSFLQITNRANVQFRSVSAQIPDTFLQTLQQLSLAAENPRLDHLRNILCSPTAGVDSQQLINTLPLVDSISHAILQHPELSSLSPKFSTGIDGGETVSIWGHPNDICFQVTSTDQKVYFRLFLNTEKRAHLTDTGILVAPENLTGLVIALAKIYAQFSLIMPVEKPGKKPRLRQVLAHVSLAAYLQAVKNLINFPLLETTIPASEKSVTSLPPIGIYPQKKDNLFYVGVVIPLGKLSTKQLQQIAALSAKYGTGIIRLTPWQNLLIPNIPQTNIIHLQQALENLNFSYSVNDAFRAIVACAGNQGCTASATNTTSHALSLGEFLKTKFPLLPPLKIHFTGCIKSCAQPPTSDITFLGIRDKKHQECYHIYLNNQQGFGAEIFTNIPHSQLEQTITKIVTIYQQKQTHPQQTFTEFINSYPQQELKHLFHTP